MAIDASPLTLTATDGLARALREDVSLAQQAQGLAVWEAPRIQTLHRWILDTWSSGWPAELLLQPAQELVLWRDIIDQDEAGAALLSPLSAAREARRADQLARRYRLDPSRAPAWRDEHQAFLRWRGRFEARLRRQGWLTAADLPAALTRRVENGETALPVEIRLCGFVQALPPAEQALLDALRSAGVRIEREPPRAAAVPRYRREADAESQFRAIALEIRERLRPYAGHARPPPRIVLALPDPDARRELIETVFRPLLAPWLALPEGPRAAPWRWEQGRPLTEQPWIDAALAIAELETTGNEPATLSRLLLSAALWTEAERGLAAEADYRLRDGGHPRLRLALVLDALPPPLQSRFAALGEIVQTAPRRALPSAWALHWQARLDAAGWPGSDALDSAAFQAVREWTRLLTRLGSMDLQLGPVGAAEALLWLRELARNVRYSARVEHLQPLTILSFEDAAGLHCDALYIADASLDAFPGPARPSPFLAPELQAAAALPGSTPALQLQQAQRLAQHLTTLSSEICISHAGVDERGAALLPSPLFGDGSEWPAQQVSRIACRLELDAAAPSRLLLPATDPAPAVTAAEAAALRADSGLFRAWFEAPFFAFCRYRLGIGPLPRPGRGLDARGQGNLAHGVLQQFWSRIREQSALLALPDAELQAQLAQELDLLLPKLMPAADYGRAQQQLERRRQLDVLTQWLGHERRRVDDFRVELTEAPVELTIGGLPLRLRIDRIDRVSTPTGTRWLVLDYKTGRDADPRGWNAERLAEPQLPLYASHAVSVAAGVPQVDGICFGHLKDGHPALVALTNWRNRLIEPEKVHFHEDWDGQLAAWRRTLEQAALAFIAGGAELPGDVTARSYYADLLMLAGRAAEDEA
jgi:probable DNA repair protein